MIQSMRLAVHWYVLSFLAFVVDGANGFTDKQGRVNNRLEQLDEVAASVDQVRHSWRIDDGA